MNLKRAISIFLCLCFVFSMNIITLAEEEKTIISDVINSKYKAFDLIENDFSDRNMQKVKELVIDAIDTYEPYVPLTAYRLSEEKFTTVIIEVFDSYPEFFYLDLDESGWYVSGSGGYITKLELKYLATEKECDIQRDELEKAAQSVVSKMKGITNEEDKIIFLHDYICAHNAYDEDGVEGDVNLVDDYSFTAYGCLVNNVSVCQGMSDAFVLISKKIGLTSYMVSSEPMVHAWNLVKSKDAYYHLDITWDDTAEQAGLGFDGTDFLDVKGFASHSYFMKSDDEFEKLEHNYWDTYKEANDNETYKDYFWNDVYSQIFFIKGNQYYIKDSKLIKRNPKSGEETVLYTIENAKFYQNSNEYEWESKSAILAYNYHDNYLLMNLHDGVYAFDLYNETVEKVYDYKGDGYISGILYEGKTLLFDIAGVSSKGTMVEGESSSVELELPKIEIDYCDVDGDGLSVADLLAYRNYLVKHTDEIDFFKADANNDNVVDTNDLLIAVKKLANR